MVERGLQDQAGEEIERAGRDDAGAEPQEDKGAHEDAFRLDRRLVIAARDGTGHARAFQLGEGGDADIDRAEEQHADGDRREGGRPREQGHGIAVGVRRRLGRQHADQRPGRLFLPHRAIGAQGGQRRHGDMAAQIGTTEGQQASEAGGDQHGADAGQVRAGAHRDQQADEDGRGIGDVGSGRLHRRMMGIGVGTAEPADQRQCARQAEDQRGLWRGGGPGDGGADHPLAE